MVELSHTHGTICGVMEAEVPNITQKITLYIVQQAVCVRNEEIRWGGTFRDAASFYLSMPTQTLILAGTTQRPNNVGCRP